MDMESDKNIYSGKGDNSWNLFFEQGQINGCVLTRKRIRFSKNVIFGGNYRKYTCPSPDVMFREDELRIWNNIFCKYVHFSERLKQNIDYKYKSRIRDSDRILGILCRGTDYLKLKPSNHTIQPEPAEVLAKAQETVKKYECSKIWLATEDRLIAEMFEHEFGDMILTVTDRFADYNGNSDIGTCIVSQMDPVQNGLDYMTSIYALSKCDCLLAGMTNGSIISAIMSQNKYDYYYYWNLGFYE